MIRLHLLNAVDVWHADAELGGDPYGSNALRPAFLLRLERAKHELDTVAHVQHRYKRKEADLDGYNEHDGAHGRVSLGTLRELSVTIQHAVPHFSQDGHQSIQNAPVKTGSEIGKVHHFNF